ncbi:hypothetical protein FTUN_4848 [Frigoriglobus tundricola]|uniref:Nudix hydrolase domain-containing protein n=1 Tax=Frigoriglobus tundricola TaxID=2774151 RepID=A0A6M5YTE2_9BACT|nr:hypothetical protein FTUN_4848 [Frigoriglobus tundricola]
MEEVADSYTESAARRELREETRFGVGAWAPLCVASANPGTHNSERTATAHVNRSDTKSG